MIGGKKIETFYWDKEIDKAFNMLKEFFIITFILRMFDSLFRTRLKTDILRFVIKTVISQFFYDLIYRRDNWHLIAFWSRKITGVKRNYETYDGKLLAIILAFKE
jgi:hypothetical protein